MRYWRYIFLIVFSISFCEFFGDYFKLWSCQWPTVHLKASEEYPLAVNPLYVMILADTHLLGPLRGHWLDKLYREWHMRRAFQAAMLIFKPNAVFVLGDLFDEGDMVDHDEFNEYMRRFQSHFQVPSSVPLISAVGNHDIGFHYKMQPYFVDRFKKKFNNTGVEMYTIQGNHFVFINSMAMENDSCEYCEHLKRDLLKAADKLNCVKKPEVCENKTAIENLKFYSRPIILQHFPTYRLSDKSCRDHDSPHIEIYREKWEVISKTATDWLGNLLRPRLSFAGHTHHYCYSINRWGVEEYTVASYSWRNKINPSFLLVSLTPTSHEVNKCNMLQQQLVYNFYVTSFILLLSLLTWDCVQAVQKWRSLSKTSIMV